MSSNVPPQRRPLLEVDSEVLLLDDWDQYFDDVPADVVLECITNTNGHPGGVAVYRDRVVLESPEGAGTHCCYRAQLNEWVIAVDDDERLATVTLDSGAQVAVKVPAAYARAISLALASTE